MLIKADAIRAIALTGLAGFVLAGPAAAQWTQWGGPNQEFKANSEGIADKWPESGPKEVWSRDLGEGYSAVLVEDGKLYTMYRTADDKNEVVVAMNAKDGKTLWEHKYDAAPAAGHVDQFGRGPRGTPLIVGDRIYTIGVSGVMKCLNKADGSEYWSHDLWKEFDGNQLNHGYASSPIAYGNNVIALVGGKGASVVALDQQTGKPVWKSQDFENSYSTPKLINVDGKDMLAIFMAEQCIGLDPANGELFWQFEHKNQWKQNVCMPEWDADNHILFFSASGAGAKGVKLSRKGDKIEAEEIWSTRKIQFYHVTSVKVGDVVYGSSGSGNGPSFFAAIDVTDGKVKWRKRGFGKATTVYADGKLIILDEDGNLGLATATPEKFEVHSKTKVLEPRTWTVPTVAGDTMYIRDTKKIAAYDIG